MKSEFIRNHWIPIKKKLPPTNELVLLIGDDMDYEVGSLNFVDPLLWGGVDGGSPTHWFPMPHHEEECEEALEKRERHEILE